MAIVRIQKEEMDTVVRAAERKAKRMNARFVVDRQRVEIVEDSDKETEKEASSENDASYSFL